MLSLCLLSGLPLYFLHYLFRLSPNFYRDQKVQNLVLIFDPIYLPGFETE